MDYLKAEQIGANKWRVLAIPFGGPMKDNRDLDREWFDAETDIKARWFGDERPVIWHHDQDPLTHRKNKLRDDPDDSELGVEDDLTESKVGWWGRLWLDRSNQYWAQVDAMLRQGKIFGSSGAIGHMVRKSKNGHIDVWPHAEQTLTPTPANFYSVITASKALANFNSAGIDLGDDVKAELDRIAADDLPPTFPTGGDEAARARMRALAIAEAARHKRV